MTPITMFKFTHIPFEKSEISSVDVYIVAPTRKEAELINLKCYKFFDQDRTVSVEEVLQGFKNDMYN